MSNAEREQPALIDCETAARALYDYLDGRLPTATMEVVQHHVETCRACASHFAFSRRVLELVPAALPLADESHGLRLRIVETLKSEGYREA
jgi:anti-sigma factor RsiW